MNPFNRREISLPVQVVDLLSIEFDGWTNNYNVEVRIHGGPETLRALRERTYCPGGRVILDGKELAISRIITIESGEMGACIIRFQAIDVNAALRRAMAPTPGMTSSVVPPNLQWGTHSTEVPAAAFSGYFTTTSHVNGASPPPAPSPAPSTLATDANNSRARPTFGPVKRKLVL